MRAHAEVTLSHTDGATCACEQLAQWWCQAETGVTNMEATWIKQASSGHPGHCQQAQCPLHCLFVVDSHPAPPVPWHHTKLVVCCSTVGLGMLLQGCALSPPQPRKFLLDVGGGGTLPQHFALT